MDQEKYSPNSYFENIKPKNSSLWITDADQAQVDYPTDGHNNLFESEERSFWFINRNKYIVSMVKSFKLRPPFFDIGGGNGIVSKAIEAANFPTLLLEPGGGAINAHRRGLPRVIQAKLQDLQKKRGIPSAGLFDVIEHIELDEPFLKDLNLYLDKEAFVLITVPAYRALWSNEDVYAHHHRRYTKTTLHQVLKKAGLTPVFSSYIFSYLILPIFLFRTIPTFFGIEAKNDKDKIESDHVATNFIARLATSIFNFLSYLELKLIEKRISVPFGSSIICIAQKK